MAALTAFGGTVLLSSSVANPINSSNYQVVMPWGKSSVRATLREAWYDVMDRTGGQQGGVQGAYLNSQTGNAPTLLGQSATMNATTTVTGLTATAGLQVGWGVWGTSIAAGTTIASIVSATSITLSVAATGSTTNLIYFVPQTQMVGTAVAANEVGIP